jgi:2-oxoglutarate dehydrogenase E2 component (dihydrolipoamide succinyltransferase)
VFDGDNKVITYRDYVDISIAVSSPSGLVVPVLRNCEDMSFAGVESGIGQVRTLLSLNILQTL